MSKPYASSIDLRRGLLPALVFAVFWGAAALGAFSSFEVRLGDLLFRGVVALRPPVLSPRIVPVDLNDAAAAALAGRVDDRRAFAAFLDIAAEGRLPAGLDFLFAGAKDASGDAALASALASSPRAVLPVVAVDPRLGASRAPEPTAREDAALRRSLWHPRIEGSWRIPEASAFLLPAGPFLEAAPRLGHITLVQDPDGLYRRSPLFFKYRDGYLPALPLALAAAAGLVDPASARLEGGRLVLERPGRGTLSIPLDGEGQVLVSYPGRWAGLWPRYPLDKVLSDAASPERLDALLSDWDGCVLLLADTTTARKDFGAVPLEAVHPLSGVHTALLNSLYTGAFTAAPGPLQRFWLPAFLLLGLFALGACPSRRLFLGGAAGLSLAFCAASAVGLFLGVQAWVLGPLAGSAAAVLAWAAREALADARQKLLLLGALERYFPASVSAKVLAEGRSALPPEKKVVSILFADVAGFTKWSSDKDPELVHRVLSIYLEEMTGVLFSRGGTVDKFMGDGIMAFFGDPYPQEDHAARALDAALAMQEKAALLRARWDAEGLLPLTIRVGVNTGEAVVGNLGSADKVEYTAIGASVNLAQRMEGSAPPGGVLASAAARNAAGEGFRYSGARLLPVKGYAEPVECYEVLGLSGTGAGSSSAS